jgi:hypothetical protein
MAAAVGFLAAEFADQKSAHLWFNGSFSLFPTISHQAAAASLVSLSIDALVVWLSWRSVRQLCQAGPKPGDPKSWLPLALPDQMRDGRTSRSSDEGDVVFGRYLESLDRPFGDLDFRHARTCSRNVPTPSVLTGRRFVEASWKRRDESRGVALRGYGRNTRENKSS